MFASAPPRTGRGVLLLLFALALPRPAEAKSGWRWGAELRLSGGYDSNAFLDAAALPSAATVDQAGGPLLQVAPAVMVGWAPTLGQELLLGYLAQLDQYLGGDVGRETAFRHGPLLAYLPPAFKGFDLLIQGGLQQLLFRTADVGWIQAFGRFRLGRALGERLWLGLAYLVGHVAYEAGAVADGDPAAIAAVQNEWTHNLEASLRWRLRPLLVAEVGYTLTRVLAQPRSFLDTTVQPAVLRVPPDDAFDAWRQGGGLTLRWRPRRWLGLEASYRFWWIGYDAGSGPHGGVQQGPPPTVPTRTFLHEVGAMAELGSGVLSRSSPATRHPWGRPTTGGPAALAPDPHRAAAPMRGISPWRGSACALVDVRCRVAPRSMGTTRPTSRRGASCACGSRPSRPAKCP